MAFNGFEKHRIKGIQYYLGLEEKKYDEYI